MPRVSSRPGARFEVRFDDLSFQEDLGRATKRGREVAIEARERLDRNVADPSELLGCQTEHREGTELPNCVKVYLPPTDGRWGMVFELVREPSSGKFVLAYLAFGERHPDPQREPDVYQRAHDDCTQSSIDTVRTDKRSSIGTADCGRLVGERNQENSILSVIHRPVDLPVPILRRARRPVVKSGPPQREAAVAARVRPANC